MAEVTKFKQPSRLWPALAFIFILVSIGLLIALIVVVVEKDKDSGATHLSVSSDHSTCGSGPNPNGNTIDLRDPATPGPFHDLTVAELVKLQNFLQTDPAIRAVPSEFATVNSSYVYMADLMPARKAAVLNYLDGNGPQPARQARVLLFRGDLEPQVVQEVACGPLPEVTKCELLPTTARRNPVEFTVRPFNGAEFISMHFVLLREVDRQIGYILRESFGTSFHDCGDYPPCLSYGFSPVGTALSGDINRRLIWVYGQHPQETPYLQSLDFALLFDLTSNQASEWGVDKVWYNGALHGSLDDFIVAYNTSSIAKARVMPPAKDSKFGSLTRRGEYSPRNPQRPPQQVEPDGKRYSISGRKATYLDWTFNFRLSSTNGPFLYDLRFKGERIAYELGLSEISVFYAGGIPHTETMNFLDSGALLGTHSKALVPGADCPETSTFINQTFISQYGGPPSTYRNAFCMFEQNNGYPLRRHLSYTVTEGGIYGGMLDSALTLRSILTIGNYDYVVDFILHQNGAVETRFMSTGYILTSYNSEKERHYGFQLHQNLVGNLHHHMSHFKVDLDVGGTSNRYETLDIRPEAINTTLYPNVEFHQIGYTSNLKSTETEALYNYNFDTPKYHVIHNQAQRTALDQIKGYRIQMNGMSKQLVPEGTGNEGTAAWARHQLVVTRHKDEEFMSTSNYGMYDSLNPVVDFSSFYEDDESIVDQDLVFWITCGFHHIPHTEDIPVTPTVGNHLSFFLLPYNYFKECPSMVSRDAIVATHVDKADPTRGVRINRHGQSTDVCVTQESTLEQDVDNDPDMLMETLRRNKVD